MQKLILILSAIFLGQISYAQIVFSPQAMNVLYIGVENPIRVGCQNVNLKKISIWADGVTFTSSGNGDWDAKPIPPVTSTWVYVEAEDEFNRIIYDSVLFRIKRIPDPYISVSRKKSGHGTPPIIASRMAFALNDDFPFEVNYRIVKLSMYFVLGNDLVVAEGDSGIFTEEQLELIKSLEGGDRLFVNAVVAINDGFPRRKLATNFTIL